MSSEGSDGKYETVSMSTLHSPAHEVDATIHANQSTGSHVANQAIIFDGEVAGPGLPHLAFILGRTRGSHGGDKVADVLHEGGEAR
jgi:hypothetical protein